MLRVIPMTLAVVAALLLGSCASEEEPDADTIPSEVDHFPEFAQFAELALSDPSPNSLEQAAEMVSPGSPAERYIQHQIGSRGAQVAEDGGQAVANLPFVTSDPVARTVTAESGYYPPYTWTDPEFDSNGLVVTWTSTATGPLVENLWTQAATASAAGVTVTVDSAYLANSGDLYVVVTFEAPEGIEYMDDPTYVDSQGRAVSAARSWEPNTIPAGASGVACYLFPGADLGGRLVFDELNDQEVTLELPVE